MSCYYRYERRLLANLLAGRLAAQTAGDSLCPRGTIRLVVDWCLLR